MLKRQVIRMVAAWLLLVGFLVCTRPDKLPVIGLIVPFLLVFAAFYCTWCCAAVLRGRLAGRTARAGYGHSRRLGATVSSSLVLLLVLQSLGQLTLKDVLTLAAILALGYFYLTRSRLQITKH